MPASDAMMLNLEAQMRSLLAAGEIQSVTLLGGLFCSLAPGGSKRSAVYILYADALLAKSEFKRAIRYYAVAIACDDNPDEINVRLKMAKAMHALDDVEGALHTLSAIPAKARTLSVYMLLGKLYKAQGLAKLAEDAFKSVLAISPYAVEASLALAEVSAVLEQDRPQGSTAIASLYEAMHLPPTDAMWLPTLTLAHLHSASHRHPLALDAFATLGRTFPSSLHCTLLRAMAHIELEQPEAALSLFQRARQLDATSAECMDVYAGVLKQSGHTMPLNNLVRELFSLTEGCPEVWVAAAAYAELKGDAASALQLADRAVSVAPSFARGHLCRGHVLLQMGRPEHAVGAFTTANQLAPSVAAFEGLVESFCDLCLKGVDKYLDAMTAARLALLLAPHSPRALVLLGTVLALRPESRDKARRTFEKVLSLNPGALRARFGLIDLFISDNNLPRAIAELEALVAKKPRDVLFAKLGDVYTMHREYAQALPAYHKALSLNPAMAQALHGLDRVEKLMRGEDPDAALSSIQMDDTEDVDDASDYHGTPNV
ncbi:anaphase-promoting complex subunit 7 [Achlya hypogyna]|uniref:Anaphase-promoting complex subunit 7 n=1 Tax=Achlya hypogyna TaxID=1202772 RepID=A0A1V9YK98_ACHHY|nr:anaphase-promoting complex subunit 7 [Achlya hypogyna]